LRAQYQGDKAAALKLVRVGERARNPKLEVTEVAAWTGLATVVLNLDEVVNKE
jgi:hypothetical protein